MFWSCHWPLLKCALDKKKKKKWPHDVKTGYFWKRRHITYHKAGKALYRPNEGCVNTCSRWAKPEALYSADLVCTLGLVSCSDTKTENRSELYTPELKVGRPCSLPVLCFLFSNSRTFDRVKFRSYMNHAVGRSPLTHKAISVTFPQTQHNWSCICHKLFTSSPLCSPVVSSVLQFLQLVFLRSLLLCGKFHADHRWR